MDGMIHPTGVGLKCQNESHGVVLAWQILAGLVGPRFTTSNHHDEPSASAAMVVAFGGADGETYW